MHTANSFSSSSSSSEAVLLFWQGLTAVSLSLPQHAGLEPWPVISALQSASRHCPHSPAGSGLFREPEECQSAEPLRDWSTGDNTKTKKGENAGETSRMGILRLCVLFTNQTAFHENRRAETRSLQRTDNPSCQTSSPSELQPRLMQRRD